METVEKGMKNHALVPLPLVSSIANLRHGGTHKIVANLLRDKLLSHENKKLDGYRLTNAGYDILALHHLKKRGFIAALGQRIGTGKESDIYLAAAPQGEQIVLKFHRLGRNSFRNVKKKRDYFGSSSAVANQAHSWLFLSRLSALREFAFMKALYDVQYPTPTPIGHNRHIVAMSLVRGTPLFQIHPKRLSMEQACDIYEQSVSLAVRLAQKHGLVHCDLNEFNLLVDLSGGVQSMAAASDDPYVRHSGKSVTSGTDLDSNIHVHASSGVSVTGGAILSKPAWEQSLEANDNIAEAIPEPIARLSNGDPKPVVILIDFPQMTSVSHPNAQELYERDLACLRRFFELKLHCNIPDDSDETAFSNVVATLQQSAEQTTEKRLDAELRASGYTAADGGGMQQLELYYFENGPQPVSTAVEELEEEHSDDAEEKSDDSDESGRDEHSVDDENDEGNFDLKNSDIIAVTDRSADFEAEIALEQEDNLNENNTVAADRSVLDLQDDILQSFDRKRLEEIAKERVRKQLEDQRRKSRKMGAFRRRNNNKTFVKGKRVMADAGF